MGNTTAGEIIYKEITLDNGLKVILNPNNKAPIVQILVLYHVGSKNENTNRTGFAHLFEHMMFEGSENIKKTEHFGHVVRVGGTLNGSTFFDITDYYEALPSEYLELGLWLEADRMRALDITQENFDNQRAVVTEEYRQRYENSPYGMTFPLIANLVFKNTSYGWTSIGDMGQLAEASIEEVRNFHSKYYRPNNATLAISGDFEFDTAEELVKRHFSDIPAGETIAEVPKFQFEIDAQRREVYYDNVPAAKVFIVFKGAEVGHKYSETLDVISAIMGEGRSSRLQSELVYCNNPLASSVSCSNLALENSGMMIFSATCEAGKTPEEVEKKLFEEISLLKSNGANKRELDKCLNYIETMIANTNQYLIGVANSLASNSVLQKNIGRTTREMEYYNAVSLQNIQEVATNYLDEAKACVLHYLPKS